MFQASGVKVSDESKSIYEELKSKKKAIRYVIFKIEDGYVQIEKTGKRDTEYKEFLEEIKKLEKECRYLLYDYPEPCKADGAKCLDRLLLVAWLVSAFLMSFASVDITKISFHKLRI